MKKLSKYTLIRAFALMFFLFTIQNLKGETVAMSDDPNFIKASILITSIGDLPHQIVGHAAIRMECPVHNLDRVFSFNNNSANSFQKLLTEGGIGSTQELYTNYYLEESQKEGRMITSYPLNLTLNEKARLWEVLDSLKSAPVQPFSITGAHCGSMAAHAIDLALAPDYVYWDEPQLQKYNYGYLARLSEGGRAPWSYVLLGLGLGTLMDSKMSGIYYVSPTIFEKEYDQFHIYSANGNVRPLIYGNPKVLLPESGDHSANRPTPFETSLIILIIVVIVTAFQIFKKVKLAGTILDWALWILVTGGGLFVAYLTFGPLQYGSGWNWVLIILNPLGWLPIVLLRKSIKWQKYVWLTYAVVLFFFAAFINYISPTLDSSWRIFALALSIRCGWHSVKIVKKL